jgi:hypothetical protein
LRHAIRAAFLDPSITEQVLRGTPDVTVSRIRPMALHVIGGASGSRKIRGR